jgi:hypothetical protein
LFFSGKGGMAAAFDDKIAVGQDINDPDGDLVGDGLRIVDLSAAGVIVLAGEIHGRVAAALGQQTAGGGAVEETGDAGVDGSLLGGGGVVVARCAGALLDDNCQDVSDAPGFLVRIDGSRRRVGLSKVSPQRRR